MQLARTTSKLFVLCAVACLSTELAHAEPRGLLPKEGAFRRRGFALGVAAGPSAAVEFGDLQDVNGVGGNFSLRAGTTATDRMLWIAQLDGAPYLFRAAGEKIGTNQFTSLTLNAQIYLLKAVWVKTGVGLANYRQAVRGQVKLDPTEENPGLGVVTALGIDLYQDGPLALGLEIQVNTAIVGSGVVFQGVSALGLHIY